MSSFTKIIVEILSGKAEIKELPMDKLISFNTYGPPLERNVQEDVLLKVARFQTLAFQQAELGRMPSSKEATDMSATNSGLMAESTAKSLSVAEDATRRVRMLDQLIVEVIRETVPAECERFDVNYFLHTDMSIRMRPFNQRQFLD